MIERYSDAVVVHDDVQDFEELLRELEIPELTAVSLTLEEQNKLRDALNVVAKSSVNIGTGGGVQAVIGSTHFHLGKTVFVAFISLSAVAASIAAANPIAIVSTSVNAIYQASQLFTTLSDVELLACSAISRITKKQGDKKVGGTYDEIEAEIAAQGDAVPPNLNEVLRKLSENRVVATDVKGGVTRYRMK